ncbi:MAG: hypothetical protein GF341_10015 [candidate division Zixibacteria bacterium]|nr:hypothetical protein [candidate division Zixibacteria bacterium]
MVQDYDVSGTLSGRFRIDYRIRVAGPCGRPLGTFEEQWIAHGTFTGRTDGRDTVMAFTYVADVAPGGDVDGTIDFGPDRLGELSVSGNFASGRLSYQRQPSRRTDQSSLDLAVIARRWFRGVYGDNPAVVDQLGADNVVVSYPIFEKLFNQPVIRGKANVQKFAAGFSERWDDTQVTFHDVIGQGNRVALVWSVTGRQVATVDGGPPATTEMQSWGGMTLIRFNADGKIVEEVGEESAPGPYGRIADSNSEQ